ncbi:MAG: hypothetical protein JWP11_37 [Frankiales bacterium]|nr:hypothetical protein [Frankiales bacterium]
MTEAAIEFGAADVDFDGVTLGPGGLPAGAPAPVSSAFTPPTPPLPADLLPPPPGVHALSDLEQLRLELTAELDLDDVTLPVPLRPSFQVRYRLVVDAHEMQPWRRDAYDPTCLEGIDQTKLALLGLAALNTGLFLDGRLVLDDEAGAPLTIGSPSILAMLKVSTAPEAVLALYGLSAHVTASWSSVLAESGFGVVLHPVGTIGQADFPERPDPS